MNTIPPMTLAEAGANLRPTNLIVLLLMFLAFLRKMGWLPDEKDEEYTKLGLNGGFQKAGADASARINAMPNVDWTTKAALQHQLTLAMSGYQSGSVVIQ